MLFLSVYLTVHHTKCFPVKGTQIQFEMKMVSSKQKNVHIGLPIPSPALRYEMNTASYKRGLS